MHPDPVLALQVARRGPLDYESAMVLMIGGNDNLPIRPKTLGPRSDGAVFWEEQPGKRRVKRDAAADVWKSSGGKRAMVTISDPNGFGPSLARQAGHISQ